MMLHHIIEANGGLPDRVAVLFQNTGREMPETLDFVQECGSRWGVHITWLEYRANDPRFEVVSHNSASRNGEPFEALIRKRKMLPNRVARFCTAELKVHSATRYLRSLGWDAWRRAIGIRADERRRISDKPNRERWTPWHPMADAGITSRDVAAFWARQPFDLRLPNVRGNCWLGNCDGCFLKSEANLAAFTREFPERAAWWESMEALGIFSKPDATFTPPEDKMTRRQMREHVERQGDWLFNDDAYLCQRDHGECMGDDDVFETLAADRERER